MAPQPEPMDVGVADGPANQPDLDDFADYDVITVDDNDVIVTVSVFFLYDFGRFVSL